MDLHLEVAQEQILRVVLHFFRFFVFLSSSVRFFSHLPLGSHDAVVAAEFIGSSD